MNIVLKYHYKKVVYKEFLSIYHETLALIIN